MKKTLLKDSFRNIKKKFVSFLSIFLISGMGVGAYLSTINLSNSFRLNSQDYFRELNYRDVSMVSSQGVSEADLEIIRSQDFVADAEGAAQARGRLIAGGQSVDIEMVSVTERISLPELLEGRLPEKAGECALAGGLAKQYGISVGDPVRLSVSDALLEGALVTQDFTVTGIANHPNYIHRTDANFVLITLDVLDPEVTNGYYTHAFIKYDIEGYDFFSDEYEALAAGYEARLGELGSQLGQSRDEANLSEASGAVDEAEAEANRQLAEARQELEDAGKQLEDAKDEGLKQLSDGEAQLRSELAAAQAKIAEGERALKEELEKGQKQLEEAEAEAQRQIADGEAKLADAQAQYEQGQEAYKDGQAQYEEGVAEYEEKVAEAQAQLAQASALITSYQNQLNDAVSSMNVQIDSKVAEADTVITGLQSDISSIDSQISMLITSSGAIVSNAQTRVSDLSSQAAMIGMISQFMSADDIRSSAQSALAMANLMLAFSQEAHDTAYAAASYLNSLGIDLGQDSVEQEAAYLITAVQSAIGALNDLIANADDASVLTFRDTAVSAMNTAVQAANDLITAASALQANLSSLYTDTQTAVGNIVTNVVGTWDGLKAPVIASSGIPKANAAISLIDNVIQLYQTYIPASVRALTPLASVETQIANARSTLVSAVSQIGTAQDQINEGYRQLTIANSEFETQKAEAEAQLAEAKQQLDEAEKQLTDAAAQIEQGKSELEKAKADAEAQIAAAWDEYYKAKAEGEKQLADARAAYASGKAQGEAKLAEGQEIYESQIADAQAQLEDGWQQYSEGEAEADAKLSEARAQLSTIPKNNWLVLGRSVDAGTKAVEMNYKNAENIGRWVGLMFIIIGVLVCFSTITIIINEQIRLVGVQKANGFYVREILSKYLVFSLLAALIGIVISAVLSYFLSGVILPMFRDMFIFDTEHVRMQMKAVVISAALTLLVTTAACVFACIKLLSAPAVNLLAGKAKNEGSRRAGRSSSKKGGSLYSRLIVRNMLSEPARVAVSIVIIAASCMVIGVAFDLNKGFNSMVDEETGKIYLYDLKLSVPSAFSEDEAASVRETLDESGAQGAFVNMSRRVFFSNGTQGSFNLIVSPQKSLDGYFGIREAEGSPQLDVPESGMLVDARAETYYGAAGAGSVLLMDPSNLGMHTAQVCGTFVNYQDTYAVMSSDYYEEIFGIGIEPNTVLIRLNGADAEALSSALAGITEGAVVETNNAFADSFKSIATLFNVLIYVMIGVAVIMTFFVLTNLVNIFVAGKARDLIVMRINGFSKKQCTGYLIRETLLTTLSGIALGVIIGNILSKAALASFGSTDYTLVHHYYPLNWAAAIAIELVFAVFINFFAFRRAAKMELSDINKV